MSAKFKTYVTMRNLGSFTVEELSKNSGVGLATIGTVLNRFKTSDRLEENTLTTGKRGGQPIQYILTDVGKVAIETELGQFDLPPLQAVLPETKGVPLGLLAAEDMVKRLANNDVHRESREALIKQVHNNLAWAEKELINLDKSTIANFQSRINLTRIDLTRIDLTRIDLTRIDLMRSILPNRLSDSFLSELYKHLSEVLIAPVTQNKEAVSLASFTEGMLSAVRPMMFEHKIPIHNLSLNKALAIANGKSDENASRLGVFLTMNSAIPEKRVKIIFKEITEVSENFNNVVILDSAESKVFANVAKEFNLFYQPNARSLEAVDYIDCLNKLDNTSYRQYG